MSGGSKFLARQKKSELADLAEGLGLDYEGKKKTELEVELEDYLLTNSSTLSNEPRFSGFYNGKRGSRAESSPVKKEPTSLLDEVTTQAKSVRRRVTKAAEDFLATDDSEIEPATTRARSALTRTPARAFSNLHASNVPLPPSPAVIVDAIDRRTQVIRSKIADVYEESGISEATDNTREALSSVVSIHALIIAFELFKLRPELLPNRDAFVIPAIDFLKTNPYQVKIPDLFLLLTPQFWGPALLWAVTTFFIPLAAGYFFNLTSKPNKRTHSANFSYTFDPLTFNIVKALLVFVIFGQDVTFGGLVDLENVARINSAIYGGYKGALTGTAIGILVTIYDAIKK